MPVMMPGAGAFVVVHAVGGQRRQLEERAARVEQAVDAVARQQLAAGDVTFPGALRAAERGRGELGAQLRHQRQMLVAVRRREPSMPPINSVNDRLTRGMLVIINRTVQDAESFHVE